MAERVWAWASLAMTIWPAWRFTSAIAVPRERKPRIATATAMAWITMISPKPRISRLPMLTLLNTVNSEAGVSSWVGLRDVAPRPGKGVGGWLMYASILTILNISWCNKIPGPGKL